MGNKSKRKVPVSESDLSKWFIQQKNTLILFGVLGVLFTILINFVLNGYLDNIYLNKDDVNNWSKDNNFKKILESEMGSLDICDLPIYDLKLKPYDLNLINQKTLDYPFILRNSISHWHAFDRWSKANFTKLYGDQIIQIGTESSIVYGGGSSAIPLPIREYINHMNQVNELYKSNSNSDILSSTLDSFQNLFSTILEPTLTSNHDEEDSNSNSKTDSNTKKTKSTDESTSTNDIKSETKTSSKKTDNKKTTHKTSLSIDSFVFDSSILNYLYELKNDFRIPKYFSLWDNPTAYKKGTVNHMLSIGSSRTGLPFHYHGHTWLGLVHGTKLWLMYPPGVSPPERLEREYNPLHSVQKWLMEIYPLLKDYPRPWQFIKDKQTGVYEPINPDEIEPPFTASTPTPNDSSSKSRSSSSSDTCSGSTGCSTSSGSGSDTNSSKSSSNTEGDYSDMPNMKKQYFPREMSGDYRPLQCLQQQGDIIYLPAGMYEFSPV